MANLGLPYPLVAEILNQDFLGLTIEAWLYPTALGGIQAPAVKWAWTDPDAQYIVLATINNGQDVGMALLKHGSGWYIVTSLENEEAGDVVTNTPIMENLIYYAVSLLQTAAVEYRGKLTANWGRIKSMYQIGN